MQALKSNNQSPLQKLIEASESANPVMTLFAEIGDMPENRISQLTSKPALELDTRIDNALKEGRKDLTGILGSLSMLKAAPASPTAMVPIGF